MTQDQHFLTILDQYYQAHGRDLPWRVPEADGSFDPYKILVSEIMLQQTQVQRVKPKYQAFLLDFPTMQALAQAGLPEVLAAWSGLGYNRRAKYLHETAKLLAKKVGPLAYEELVACPGVGPNTAAAVLAYSYDLQVIFIETNIRTVIIHHFFEEQIGISDKEILNKLYEEVPWGMHEVATKRSASSKSSITSSASEQVLAVHSPRDFYWAMMDYGTHLKATVGNLSRQSKSYIKQSNFQGSKRQIRGHIIKLLLAGPQPITQVKAYITDPRLDDILAGLAQEKLVRLQGKTLMLYNESIKP